MPIQLISIPCQIYKRVKEITKCKLDNQNHIILQYRL